MMEAFHSNWTAPFYKGKNSRNYFIEDFEILTTILSALKWREKNGNIRMVTDEIGAEYYKKIGIESIWNLGIDVTLDNIVHEEINPNSFWAAGKIYSLKYQEAPTVMIDTDFIVWNSVKDLLKDKKVCTIHKEDIFNDVYPKKEYFKLRNGYEFDKAWDWKERPSNTAFAYISDENFKNYYVDSAIEFMKNAISGEDKLRNMVFAEQRLISMCARKMGIVVEEISDLDTLFNKGQTDFTHVWGFKREIKKDFFTRSEFCIRCIRRIIKDYPEYEEVLANMKQMAYFYRQYKGK